MRALLFILILLVSVSCGSDPLEPQFARRLTHFSGCADVIFFAVDADDVVMVTFRAVGLVTAARAAGVETTTVFDLPSDEVELVVEVGSRISDATCDDVIENSGPRVRRSWTAASGTATVRIRPLDDSSGGRGDLVLEDVDFRSDGADDASLEFLAWLDVSVGWFPG
jgi:hypothetical protein